MIKTKQSYSCEVVLKADYSSSDDNPNNRSKCGYLLFENSLCMSSRSNEGNKRLIKVGASITQSSGRREWLSRSKNQLLGFTWAVRSEECSRHVTGMPAELRIATLYSFLLLSGLTRLRCALRHVDSRMRGSISSLFVDYVDAALLCECMFLTQQPCSAVH